MHRRKFVKLIATGGALVSARCSIGPIADPCTKKSFYVAGVRFSHAQGRLKSGDPVKIKAGMFRNERCYAILNTESQRIGYIPRRMLRGLDGWKILESYVSAVNEYAVPWKRYRITLVVSACPSLKSLRQDMSPTRDSAVG